MKVKTWMLLWPIPSRSTSTTQTPKCEGLQKKGFIFFFSFVFVKRNPVVEAGKSFSSQLHMVTLGDGSPFETLHAMISSVVSPYYKSYIKESGKAER